MISFVLNNYFFLNNIINSFNVDFNILQRQKKWLLFGKEKLAEQFFVFAQMTYFNNGINKVVLRANDSFAQMISYDFPKIINYPKLSIYQNEIRTFRWLYENHIYSQYERVKYRYMPLHRERRITITLQETN